MTREMKDSGIEWVDEIPNDWKVTRVSCLFGNRKNPNHTGEEENRLSLSYGQVVRKDINSSDGLLPESFNTYNIVEPGDIIIRPTDLQNDKRSLRTGLSKDHGIITSAYIALKPIKSQIDSRYYHYLLHSYDIEKVFYNMGNGVRQGLTFSLFAKLPIVEPSLSEQQSIANYLNHKTSQIDALVSNIEAQIAKLDEYKKTLITQAVTKGLDPNAEMKDSGVEWISTIPEKWNIAPLKSIFSFGKGLSITKDDLIESGSPVISYGQIHAKDATGTSIKDRHIRYVSEDYLSTSPSSLAKQGDIIVADTSEDLEGAGNATFVDRPTIFAGYHTILLKNNGKADGKYISYLMKTDQWRKQIRTAIWAVKVYSISQTVLRRTSVLLPPLSEQQQIANYLDQKTTQIDDLKQALKLKLDALANYKKTLIFDYVTGKKEVPADFKKEDAHE